MFLQIYFGDALLATLFASVIVSEQLVIIYTKFLLGHSISPLQQFTTSTSTRYLDSQALDYGPSHAFHTHTIYSKAT